MAAIFTSCATSPLGRKQLIVVSDDQMNQLGVQSFQQMKSTEKIDSDPTTVEYVNCIVKPLTEAAKGKTPVTNWEVVVFKSDQVNAFALPGGKIGVYSQLLEVAKTDAQLAAVLGHEIGHVIARHGAERISDQTGTELGLAALGAATANTAHQNLLLGLLGLGAQVGIMLPFSRTQEGEADLIGLNLMAEAGFDPEQSIELWKNMTKNSGGKAPPQFLSDHPADENRIKSLEENMPAALDAYHQAQQKGLHPACVRPK